MVLRAECLSGLCIKVWAILLVGEFELFRILVPLLMYFRSAGCAAVVDLPAIDAKSGHTDHDLPTRDR
jgi:hypothetical protein